MTEWRATLEPGYEVSDDGRVRSVDRIMTYSDGRQRFYPGQELARALSSNGYLKVSLGRGKQRSVHVLVCEAWHGPKPAKRLEVRHLNGNGLDNRPANLKWGTRKQNIHDAMKHGTFLGARRLRRA